MSLSEKIQDRGFPICDLNHEDVREAVKELKEKLMFKVDNDGTAISEMKDNFNKEMFNKIDEIFGEKLI